MNKSNAQIKERLLLAYKRMLAELKERNYVFDDILKIRMNMMSEIIINSIKSGVVISDDLLKTYCDFYKTEIILEKYNRVSEIIKKFTEKERFYYSSNSKETLFYGTSDIIPKNIGGWFESCCIILTVEEKEFIMKELIPFLYKYDYKRFIEEPIIVPTIIRFTTSKKPRLLGTYFNGNYNRTNELEIGFAKKTNNTLKREKHRFRISSKEVFKVFKTCTKCGTTENLVLDHHFPIKLGGTNNIENVGVLCSACNGRKNGKEPKEFYTEQELEKHCVKLANFLKIHKEEEFNGFN